MAVKSQNIRWCAPWWCTCTGILVFQAVVATPSLSYTYSMFLFFYKTINVQGKIETKNLNLIFIKYTTFFPTYQLLFCRLSRYFACLRGYPLITLAWFWPLQTLPPPLLVNVRIGLTPSATLSGFDLHIPLLPGEVGGWGRVGEVGSFLNFMGYELRDSENDPCGLEIQF